MQPNRLRNLILSNGAKLFNCNHKVVDSEYRMRAIRTSYSIGRRYSQIPNILFISNEQRHIFDSEKLTPEENDAAIPSKPSTINIPKQHHYIANPEEVCDLLMNPRAKDILVTVLSEKSPILGPVNYKFMLKNGSQTIINTYFANLSCSWIDIFNKLIKPLRKLDNDFNTIKFNNTILDSIIVEKLNQFDLKDDQLLANFYESLNAFKNSQSKAKGLLTRSELTELITVEYLSLYLVNSDFINEKSENFTQLLSFIINNIQYFANSSIKELFVSLIDNVYDSSLHTSVSKLNSFAEFVSYLDTNPSFDILELDSSRLDKLVFLLALSGNLKLGKLCLQDLVLKKNMAPSSETLDAFLASYENMERGQILKEFSDLKSVFFHRQLSPTVFSILMQTIDNITDFEHFINLIELRDHDKKLITQYQYELFEKLDSIQQKSNSTKLEKLLQITQLIYRIVTSKEIKLNSRTIQHLGNAYLEVGNTVNIEVLCRLNNKI